MRQYDNTEVAFGILMGITTVVCMWMSASLAIALTVM